MAYLKSKTLFFTTSPRSPLKMIPEIEILDKYFDGKVWNAATQVKFIKKLAEGSDFEGKGSTRNICIAYFYALHTMNIAFYGGQSVIVPLELDVFINMVEQSYRAEYAPDSEQVKAIFDYSLEQAKIAIDENDWYGKIKEKALNWL